MSKHDFWYGEKDIVTVNHEPVRMIYEPKEWWEKEEIKDGNDLKRNLELAKLKGFCWCELNFDDGDNFIFIKKGLSASVLIYKDGIFWDKWDDCHIDSYWMSGGSDGDYYQSKFESFCLSCF